MIAALAIHAWSRSWLSPVDEIAFEWPQIYARDTPARANAVVSMAGVDMALAALCGAKLHCYLPAEIWGQLPKATTGKASISPRAVRVISRLDAIERARVPDQHDAIDAVGIGLFALGRLGIRRALSAG